jgi:hypothetical protein
VEHASVRASRALCNRHRLRAERHGVRHRHLQLVRDAGAGLHAGDDDDAQLRGDEYGGPGLVRRRFAAPRRHDLQMPPVGRRDVQPCNAPLHFAKRRRRRRTASGHAERQLGERRSARWRWTRQRQLEHEQQRRRHPGRVRWQQFEHEQQLGRRAELEQQLGSGQRRGTGRYFGEQRGRVERTACAGGMRDGLGLVVDPGRQRARPCATLPPGSKAAQRKLRVNLLNPWAAARSAFCAVPVGRS